MTPVRIIDTQRLAILAHEYERVILGFHRDLQGDRGGIERIRAEAARVPFQEFRTAADGGLVARLGTGKQVVLMDTRGDTAAAVGMIYAAKLIDELGMYDDFTLWVTTSARCEIHASAVLAGEPTSLRIRNEGLRFSHPLVQAAVDTYETIFELPPVLNHAPPVSGPKGVPTVAFGATTDGSHLLQAAQFYAAFPLMFALTMKRR